MNFMLRPSTYCYVLGKNEGSLAFAYGAITVFGSPFQEILLANEFVTFISSFKF